MKRKQAAEAVRHPNNALLNVVAPLGISFGKNDITIGENYAKVHGITQYPAKVDIGWLSALTGLSETIVTICYEPVDNVELLKTISRNIKAEAGRIDTSHDRVEIKRAERSVKDNDRLIDQIDDENETVGLVTILIMALSDDEDKFTKICRTVISRVIGKKCKIRSIPNLQRFGFEAISPSFPHNKKINSIVNRIMPMTTFMGGIPFAVAGFTDKNSYYFAEDHLGGPIMLNIWYRDDKDRGNGNIIVMGKSGVGKSTATKAQLIMNEYMIGTKIIVIDPETEYKDLCRHVEGDWINAAGGSKGMINPLQVRPSPKAEDDSEEEELYIDEGIGLNDLALHIKNLEIFFSLYLPSLTDMHMAILKKEIILLYQNFNITWETDVLNLSAEEFPIMKDLYDSIVRNTQKDDADYKYYKELAALLYDIAQGADSFLWNGHSTIDSDGNFLCLDTNALLGTRDNIKRAQYFLLLQYCWEKISKSREEKVMFICDEAYLMVDQKVPETLIYMRNVAKRIRKYEGSLVIISHSLIDFLAPSVKQYGQALLDNPCYKILMGTEGQNLKDTTALYNLTEAEQELLARGMRGNALFIAGSRRMKIKFMIHQYKLDCLGKAAGR